MTLNAQKPARTAAAYAVSSTSPSPDSDSLIGTSVRYGPPSATASGTPSTRAQASHNAVATPAFVNGLAASARSIAVSSAPTGTSGAPSRAGASTVLTRWPAVAPSSPLHSGVALTSP